MSMFSSRPPFNDDPTPYVTYADHCRTDVRSDEWDIQSDGDIEYVRVHDPRPEFDRPQHNPTNPILESLRAGLEADPSADWFHTFLNTLPDWKEGSVGHARQVLTRLVTLAKDMA